MQVHPYVLHTHTIKFVGSTANGVAWEGREAEGSMKLKLRPRAFMLIILAHLSKASNWILGILAISAHL